MLPVWPSKCRIILPEAMSISTSDRASADHRHSLVGDHAGRIDRLTPGQVECSQLASERAHRHFGAADALDDVGFVTQQRLIVL